jgi:hypothetical protein
VENNGDVVFNEISTDQPLNREVARGEAILCARPAPPHPFLQQASGEIFKDDVDCYSSISDIWLMICGPVSRDGSYKDNFDENL